MEATPETRQLEHAPVGRLLWQLSMPAICASLVGATYNIVDRVFVGWRFDSDGITAVTLSFPIMLIMQAVGMMIGIGSNTLISIRIGEKNKAEAESILGQALFLFVAVSVVFTVFGLLNVESLLRLFGADDVVMPQAKEYLIPILCGSIFQTMSFGVNSFLRGEGKPRIAMVTMLIVALVNIVLDWVFLFGFRTGIWGAALATVIAQALALLWIAWYYLSGRTLLGWHWRYVRLHPRLAVRVFLVGLPPFVMQTAACVLHGFQNHQLSYYGNLYGHQHGLEGGGRIAIAIMGMLFSIFMMLLLPLLGIGQGLQPIAGYNTGAHQYQRVRHAATLALTWGLLFASSIYVVVLFYPAWFIMPFVSPDSPDHAVMLELGAHAVRIFASLMPCVAVIVISSGYFQAIGHALLALLLTLLRQVFLLIPSLYLLPHLIARTEYGVPLDGIWLSHPVADLGAFALAVGLLIREYHRLRGLEAGLPDTSIPPPMSPPILSEPGDAVVLPP